MAAECGAMPETVSRRTDADTRHQQDPSGLGHNITVKFLSLLTHRMKVFRGFHHPDLAPACALTIGNFDGHHVGHQALLRQVIDSARNAQGTAMVVTFDPHPVKILAPHVDLRFLTSRDEKLARFEAVGIDEVVFLEIFS